MAEKVLTALTTKSLRSLLPGVLQGITATVQQRPDLILAAWSSLIGERLAPMTEAVSFREGILTVKVRNSSLLSLLTQCERPRLLKNLRSRFPEAEIRNIRFCIG
jgi:hypothetical protein